MPFEPTAQRKQLELWAGVECTVNRVGDQYFDQLERSGHAARAADLDLLAGLGVKVVRYPVLWERTAPDGLERADWSWPDARLRRLKELNLRPIVGLVHHGSGPRATSLVDPLFPEKLARYARAVAERHPWIEDYTPVNEPLTTARFSGLYGHWYPHGRDPATFVRTLLTQVRGVVLSMRAVREVNPRARLVQTEDLGKTVSTRALGYQAEFENERRWLTFDLLCGQVVGDHPIAGYLRWAGIRESELEAVAESSTPPDVIGINHYLTSERYLDERLDRYPAEAHGGNGRHRYADVEAVRVLRDGVAGPYALLREAWERYRLPLAVTEAHLACTREHQLRWLDEVWHAAVRLWAEGADVRAVTAWSAFGAHDWASLLTRNDGHYEPGLFDIRAPWPRRTALGEMVRALATCGWFDHPVLTSPGWWRADGRLAYPPATSPGTARATAPAALRSERSRSARPRPLMIVGANGTLGRAVAHACDARGLAHTAIGRQLLDIADAHAVERVLDEHQPWAIVNCAGYVRVDDAERERRGCWRANAEGPATLARACAARGVKLVTFSTDLVFDGRKGAPYVESDPVRPVCEYGRSKAHAELAVLRANADALVVRTAAFFAVHDDFNFITLALRALAAGGAFDVLRDVVVSPTYVPDLVDAMLDLAIDGESGLWHLVNGGAVTWEELARRAAKLAGVSDSALRAVSRTELPLPARRPANTALSSERATILPSLDDALTRYARARPWGRSRGAPAPRQHHGVRGDGQDAQTDSSFPTAPTALLRACGSRPDETLAQDTS
jgi:dTDP-4-dehydrorhamnose reductase